MKYQVKKKQAKKPYWVVINDKGEIANQCQHKTEAMADKHCESLNAFFGDK